MGSTDSGGPKKKIEVSLHSTTFTFLIKILRKFDPFAISLFTHDISLIALIFDKWQISSSSIQIGLISIMSIGLDDLNITIK